MLTLGECTQIVLAALNNVGERDPQESAPVMLGAHEWLTFVGSTRIDQYFSSNEVFQNQHDAIWQEVLRQAAEKEPLLQLTPGQPKPWPPPPPPHFPPRMWPGGARPYFTPRTVLHLAEYLHDSQSEL